LRSGWLETHDLRNVSDHVDKGTAGHVWFDGHEVSNPMVMVISWSAESIAPGTMAAPHRGHAHVAVVLVVVATDAEDGTDG
jgi:hypothetical protein